MNIKEEFRSLVKNEFVPHIDYTNRFFSFRTVFYRCPYSYRCCSCGFEHEYFDYISETGEINEEMYEKIVTSIINGKCPHADNISEKYLTVSKVYAVHIAAAVGTEPVMNDYFSDYKYITTSIFNLTPFRTAVIRNQIRIVSIAQKGERSLYGNMVPAKKVLYARRTEEKEKIKIEIVSSPIFCMQRGKSQLLRGILKPSIEHNDINEAFSFAFKHGLSDMIEDLLEYLPHLHKMGRDTIVIDCAVAAIVYDQPDTLCRILQLLYLCEPEFNVYMRLLESCHVLKRIACEKVLMAFDKREPDKIDTVTLNTMLCLLSMFSDDYKPEIVNALKNTPNINEHINSSYCGDWTLLHVCIGPHQPIEPNEIRGLLEIGSDIDKVDLSGNTALLHLLSKRRYTEGFRETLEMLLYENPSTDKNINAVREAIILDAHFETNKGTLNWNGEFVFDAKEHTLFQSLGTDGYALNFVGPFLIECGFPVTRGTLVSAMEKPLHATEHEYIRRCLDTPRPLRLCARDALRNHFKRRQIHLFVESADLPRTIKDLILLKSLFVCKHN